MSVESYDQQMDDDNLSTHSCDETDGLITGVHTPEIGSPERFEIDPPENTYPRIFWDKNKMLLESNTFYIYIEPKMQNRRK